MDGDQPHRDVGDEQHDRAAEAADQQQPAGAIADQRPQQMRRDQADEADRAGDRDRGADRQRRAGDELGAQAAKVEAEARRRVLAQASARRAPARYDSSSAQPTTVSGSASHNCGRLRSASEPISQNMIS